MNIVDLQNALNTMGQDPPLVVDGHFGPKSLVALADHLCGDPTPVTDDEVAATAQHLGLTPAHVRAVLSVESSGHGFDHDSDRPIILFEPHVFHARTAGAFDAHTTISYPTWGAKPYPKDQATRYAQLFEAITLNPDAAFASASWGLFQIMGFNFAACGYDSAFLFALDMARSEARQLEGFAGFLKSQHLVEKLQAKDWAGFAEHYNGPSYARNAYDTKLRTAYSRAGGK